MGWRVLNCPLDAEVLAAMTPLTVAVVAVERDGKALMIQKCP